MTAVIRIIETPGAEADSATVELTEDVVTIGRAMECHVRINDAMASRIHCQIEREGESYKLVDLESQNGTRVNGRRVNIASYLTRVGDRVTVKDSDRSRKMIRACMEELGEPHVQNWLKLEPAKLEAEVVAMPTREDVMIPVEENYIVELCSQ